MLLLALLACSTTRDVIIPSCSLDLPVPSVAEAPPGASVTARVGPLTAAWDTVVTIGSARAEVTAVSRSGCVACDACREANACDACGPTCGACVDACSGCTDAVVFTVPDAPGAQGLVVRNGAGTSPTGAFRIRAAPTDTAPGDTGPADTGFGSDDTGR
jgi:hypothetical protein